MQNTVPTFTSGLIKGVLTAGNIWASVVSWSVLQNFQKRQKMLWNNKKNTDHNADNRSIPPRILREKTKIHFQNSKQHQQTAYGIKQSEIPGNTNNNLHKNTSVEINLYRFRKKQKFLNSRRHLFNLEQIRVHRTKQQSSGPTALLLWNKKGSTIRIPLSRFTDSLPNTGEFNSVYYLPSCLGGLGKSL